MAWEVVDFVFHSLCNLTIMTTKIALKHQTKSSVTLAEESLQSPQSNFKHKKIYI